MRVCVCVWIELEISSKRIKVLENERFWVLFWGGKPKQQPRHQKLEALCYCSSSNRVQPSVSCITSAFVFTACKQRASRLFVFTAGFQARRGGGEVSRPASAPPADVPGQTNHQQRDGAGEDEEGRATDAAAKPSTGETRARVAPGPARAN